MSFTCEICNRVFSTSFNLSKHFRGKHNIQRQPNSYPKDAFSYRCLECECSFRTNVNLIKHLQIEHSLKIVEENIKFDSFEDFKLWKGNIESKENCNYSTYVGKKVLNSGDVIQYFNCCRSGNRRSRFNTIKDVNRKRRLKSKGSVKLDYACISKITLRKRGETFFMTRIINHYGHSDDIKHLRLSSVDKDQLASKLLDGIPKSIILEEIRNNVNSDLKRVDLVTRQDLDNIKRSFNIPSYELQHIDNNHDEVGITEDSDNHETHSNNNNIIINCNKKEQILDELSNLQMLLQNQDINHLSESDFQEILQNLTAVNALLQPSTSQTDSLDNVFINVTEMSHIIEISPQMDPITDHDYI